jgi:hypothetical protein
MTELMTVPLAELVSAKLSDGRQKRIASLCIRKTVQRAGVVLNFGTAFARLRFTLGSVASHPIPLSPNAEVTAANFFNRKP